jgi:hypothetical protein
MINIFPFIKFLKEQWLGSCLIVLWVLYIIFSQKTLKDLEKQAEQTNKVIIKEKKVIDTLYKNNTVIENKIKYIEKVKYDTIKNIDTMSASELQKFFTDKYGK